MEIEQQLIAARMNIIELCKHKHTSLFHNNDVLIDTKEKWNKGCLLFKKDSGCL